MIYREVRRATRARAQLSRNQKRELGLATMLLCVVVVFFLCNFLALVVNILEVILRMQGDLYFLITNCSTLVGCIILSHKWIIFSSPSTVLSISSSTASSERSSNESSSIFSVGWQAVTLSDASQNYFAIQVTPHIRWEYLSFWSDDFYSWIRLILVSSFYGSIKLVFFYLLWMCKTPNDFCVSSEKNSHARFIFTHPFILFNSFAWLRFPKCHLGKWHQRKIFGGSSVLKMDVSCQSFSRQQKDFCQV